MDTEIRTTESRIQKVRIIDSPKANGKATTNSKPLEKSNRGN